MSLFCFLFLVVLPTVSLNEVEKEEGSVINCQAHGGWPPGNLSLTVINKGETNRIKADDGSAIKYSLGVGIYDVQCSSWQYGPNITTWDNKTFTIEGWF